MDLDGIVDRLIGWSLDPICWALPTDERAFTEFGAALTCFEKGEYEQARTELGEAPAAVDREVCWLTVLCLIGVELGGDLAMYQSRLEEIATEYDSANCGSFAVTIAALKRGRRASADSALRQLMHASELARVRSATRCLPILVTVEALLNLHAFDAAASMLEEFRAHRPSPDFAIVVETLLASWIEARRSGPRGALEQLELLTRRNPPHPSMRSPFFRSLLSATSASFLAQLGEIEPARAELEQARAASPGISRRQLQTFVDAELRIARRSGSPELFDIAERISAEPKYVFLHPLARSSLIEALIARGDFDRAWELSNQGFETEPRTDLGGWYGLQHELAEGAARQHYADEIAEQNRRLLAVEQRSAAVLSALAHGVNGPLTTVRIWLEVASRFGIEEDRDGSDGPDSQAAEAAIERLERLLDQVLWMARLDGSGQAHMRRGFSEAQTAVSSARRAVEAWCHYWDIEIEVHQQRQFDQLDTDPVENDEGWSGLDALAEALLIYAIGYARRGSTVRISIEDDPLGITLAVADSGPPLIESEHRGTKVQEPKGAIDQAEIEAEVDEQGQTGETEDGSDEVAARVGVQLGLATRRESGGDAAADMGLLVAEAVAERLGTTVELDQRDGWAIARCHVPRLISAARSKPASRNEASS